MSVSEMPACECADEFEMIKVHYNGDYVDHSGNNYFMRPAYEKKCKQTEECDWWNYQVSWGCKVCKIIDFEEDHIRYVIDATDTQDQYDIIHFPSEWSISEGDKWVEENGYEGDAISLSGSFNQTIKEPVIRQEDRMIRICTDCYDKDPIRYNRQFVCW